MDKTLNLFCIFPIVSTVQTPVCLNSKGSLFLPSALQDSSSGNVSEGESPPDSQEDSLQGRQKPKDKAATPRKDGSKRSVLSKSVPGYKVEEKSPWLRFFPDQPFSLTYFNFESVTGASACCARSLFCGVRPVNLFLCSVSSVAFLSLLAMV